MKNKGWTVALAGIGINLALGVLYAWSVIKKAIPSEWGGNRRCAYLRHANGREEAQGAYLQVIRDGIADMVRAESRVIRDVK